MNISEISNHPDHLQFRMQVDGETAWIDYRYRDDMMYLMHAEVPYQLRGHGVGKLLVEKTYAYLNKNKISAIPVCGFIRYVTRQHPELLFSMSEEE